MNMKEVCFFNYECLEEKNLELRALCKEGKSSDFFKEMILQCLANEPTIKAVTVCFTDLEGKLQSLAYDKKYLIKSYNNLTFDGSSVRGFAAQRESDLLLQIDWSSFYWTPSDIFGPGKALVFANVHDRSGAQYAGDFRGVLKNFLKNIQNEKQLTFNVAPEIEGFLLQGTDAEQNYSSEKGFELVTQGGYYNALPQDALRLFIDAVAEAQRAIGFENEKDHPEVAPSQFELNYKYTTPLEACDQIQLYKLLCRQVAKKMGYTSSFLPKPFMHMNGSGMHVNLSASANDKNLFYDSKGDGLSDLGRSFAAAILYHAKESCLILNSSVNAYRRLDPKFEAPNEIKMSEFDRSSMVRIPCGDQYSKRIEVRSVAPDCNPYLLIYTLLKIGLLGSDSNNAKNHTSILNQREKLPANIYDALGYFQSSETMKAILGHEAHSKYIELKEATANRSPKGLGNIVKISEIIYHHEVTNQCLWHQF